MLLTSPAFSAGVPLPRRYAGDGDNVSPPLSFIEVPPAARELALVCVDPDANGWIHWLLYGLAPCAGLSEAVPRRQCAAGARQGQNGWGGLGWAGPFPPEKTSHRYVFTLYALARPLGLDPGVAVERVKRALASGVLAQAELTAIYRRG